MIPASFDYVQARSITHALDVLEQHEGRAKLLAGGHSLLPTMKLRRQQPAVLVDISQIADHATISVGAEGLSIGNGVSHRALESSDVVRQLAPLLAHAASTIGDRQVRARGTVGGSIAQSNRAGDLPTALMVLNALLVITSSAGERVVPINEFFTGNERNILSPFEILTRIDIPSMKDQSWEYRKFRRRHQEWAVVLVAVIGGDEPRIALGNMNPTPVRALRTEVALRGGATIREASQLVDADCDVPDDVAAKSDYRRHVAKLLTERSLNALAQANLG